MANQLLMPNVVGAYMQGQQFTQDKRAAQQQNEFRAMQMQQMQEAQARDAQFREALPTYLQGGTNALASLYASDPERAMQVQAFQAQQNQMERARQVEQAKQTHAQAQGVLNSRAPATYLRVLIPKVAEQWAQQTGKSAEEMTDEDARSIAEQVSTLAAAQAGIQPEEYTLGEGDVRFRGGKQIASVPKQGSGADGFTLGEGQTRFDASGKPIASVAKATAEDASKREQTIFERANKLRDEYTTQAAPYSELLTSYETIKTLGQNGSPAGDIAMIASFMRAVDPGSRVTGAEQATAQNAGGVPAVIRGYYNRLLGKGELSEEQRADFLKQATNLVKARTDQHKKVRDKYTKLATRAEVNPLDVVGDEVNFEVPVSALGVGQSTSVNGFKVTRKK